MKNRHRGIGAGSRWTGLLAFQDFGDLMRVLSCLLQCIVDAVDAVLGSFQAVQAAMSLLSP